MPHVGNANHNAQIGAYYFRKQNTQHKKTLRSYSATNKNQIKEEVNQIKNKSIAPQENIDAVTEEITSRSSLNLSRVQENLEKTSKALLIENILNLSLPQQNIYQKNSSALIQRPNPLASLSANKSSSLYDNTTIIRNVRSVEGKGQGVITLNKPTSAKIINRAKQADKLKKNGNILHDAAVKHAEAEKSCDAEPQTKYTDRHCRGLKTGVLDDIGRPLTKSESVLKANSHRLKASKLNQASKDSLAAAERLENFSKKNGEINALEQTSHDDNNSIDQKIISKLQNTDNSIDRKLTDETHVVDNTVINGLFGTSCDQRISIVNETSYNFYNKRKEKIKISCEILNQRTNNANLPQQCMSGQTLHRISPSVLPCSRSSSNIRSNQKIIEDCKDHASSNTTMPFEEKVRITITAHVYDGAVEDLENNFNLAGAETTLLRQVLETCVHLPNNRKKSSNGFNMLFDLAASLQRNNYPRRTDTPREVNTVRNAG